MKAKKSAPRSSAGSASRPTSSYSRGVAERSELSAFEGQAPKSAVSTSRRKVIDPDNPPLTDAQLKRFRPISRETLDFIDRARGRPPIDNPKQAVSIRLDQDVIAHYKKSGPGWQSRINAALRKQAKLK